MASFQEQQKADAITRLSVGNCQRRFVGKSFSISLNFKEVYCERKTSNITQKDFFSEDQISIWTLRVYLRGNDKNSVFTVHLIKNSSNGLTIPEPETWYKLFIRTQNNKVLYESDLKTKVFRVFSCVTILNFERQPTFLMNLKDDELIFSVHLLDSFEEKPKIIPELTPNDLQENICYEIYNMFLKKSFTDVIINVEHKQIAAHQNILAANSPVFAAMLQSDTLEGNTKQITISDFDLKTFEETLNFLYLKNTPNFESFEFDEIINILRAADKYEINDLMMVTINYLIWNLNPKNVIEVLLLADLLGISVLKEQAIDFICENKAFYYDFEHYKDLQEKPRLLTEILVKMSRT